MTYVSTFAQKINSHNDFQQKAPFWTAWSQESGSIEMNVHLKNGQLYIAKDENEIDEKLTIENLYFEPLKEVFARQGKVYENDQPLIYLINISANADKTVLALGKAIKKYSQLFDVDKNKNAVTIVLSNQLPSEAIYSKIPSYVKIDGNKVDGYSENELSSLASISLNFRDFCSWHGKGGIKPGEKEALKAAVDQAHDLGKEVRIWNTPNNTQVWKLIADVNSDYISTDELIRLKKYLDNKPTNIYTRVNAHEVYRPTFENDGEEKRIKNIILMIGDGMGLAQVTAGQMANGGELTMTQLTSIGFSKTRSADDFTTDSAASGTAMATGSKTKNGRLSKDLEGNDLPTIPELIKLMGINSGVITVEPITGATPSAFYAHQESRGQQKQISQQLPYSVVDLFIGATNDFFPDLEEDFKKEGFKVYDNYQAVENATSDRLGVLVDWKEVEFKVYGRGDFLPFSTKNGLKYLDQLDGEGFFVMIEAPRIDHAGHRNKTNEVIEEVLDFDLAIEEAIKFAEQDGETLVIITADHETGGMSLPYGNFETGEVEGQFYHQKHTGIMVPVFAYGPHSREFAGAYENTEIFERIMKLFRKYHSVN